MRKFIASIAEEKDILPFHFEEYDPLFLKQRYHSYYLFFFLKEKMQLTELREKTDVLYDTIKTNREIYETDMDKNITCIFCLKVPDTEYYEINTDNKINELSKIVCLVEEDLIYFKKNVLLYTEDMEKFAKENAGKFDLLCKEYLKEENFQNYKKSVQSNYQYDFLINLFIKIPFLNFQKYQLQSSSGEKYKSMAEYIEDEIQKKGIDRNHIEEIITQLEHKSDSEEDLYQWLDQLITEDTAVTEESREAEDEN